MDRFGPGTDCPECGQAKSLVDMCSNCVNGHNCVQPFDFEAFLDKLSDPLAEALIIFNYRQPDKRKIDGGISFTFLSDEAPRIEIRIDEALKGE